MTVKSFCKRFSFLAFSLCLMIVTGLVSCDTSTLKKEQVDNEFEIKLHIFQLVILLLLRREEQYYLVLAKVLWILFTSF